MMNNLAIQVENLSKRYTISTTKRRNNTLASALGDDLRSFFSKELRARKKKEEIWALRNVSLDIRQGEVLGIIGRNGSGKSTLLKVLSRITEPTEGMFRSYGRIASLLEVGTGFHPELTGRENIFLNGAILGMRKQEIKVKFDEIVAFAETERFIDTPVKRYSSGMYVRLAFAVAAHLEPEILFVDEVLAVGDAAFQRKCLGKMNDVSKQGRTVLFVSHNMIAVNSLCKRTIWLNGGRVEQDGRTAQVVKNYLSGTTTGSVSLKEVYDKAMDAPGNEMVRLHEVRVSPKEEETCDALTTETPLKIEVKYWNLKAGAQLHVSLIVFTSEGVAAFSTDSFDAEWGDTLLDIGLFRSVCYIPGELLNSGLHRLVVLFVKNKRSVIFSYDTKVAFDILDLKRRHGAFHGKHEGVVRPRLKWATEYLGKQGEGEKKLLEKLQCNMA